MDNRNKLRDYTSNREVIENPKFYTPGELTGMKNFNEGGFFIKCDFELRHMMKLSKFNEKEFRVIIVRKSAQSK